MMWFCKTAFSFGNGVSAFAIQLPSSTTSITMGNILNFEYTQPWTCISKIKVTAHTTSFGQLIFTNANSLNSPIAGYEFWLDESSTGRLRVRIISDFNNNFFLDVEGSTNLVDSTYHVVAATYDGSGTAAGVKIYVDGVAETLTTIIDALGTGTIIAGGQNFIVGNQIATTDALLGKMAWIQLQNVSRTSGQIAAITTLPAVTANTVLSLPFTEGSGQVVGDVSSNAFKGAITNIQPVQFDGQASTTCNFGQVVKSGDTVCVGVFAASGAAPTVTDDKGNTYTQVTSVATGGGFTLYGYYSANITNGSSIFTASSASLIMVFEFSGVSGVLDGSGSAYNASASASSVTSSSFTTTVAGDLIFGIVGNSWTKTAAGPLFSMGLNETSWGNEYFIQASPSSTTTVEFTNGGGGTGTAWVVGWALKPTSTPNAWVSP
jgi:hypothetical protein